LFISEPCLCQQEIMGLSLLKAIRRVIIGQCALPLSGPV
jgi:hypothetical protein